MNRLEKGGTGHVRWETFEGTNYEIGYQLGQHWARRLKQLSVNPYGRAFLRRNPYHTWLREPWRRNREGLLLSFLQSFPQLLEEVCGMAQGARAEGIEASLHGILGLILGEDDEELFGCSTIVSEHGDETILAHNEEDYPERFPLCFARVRLRTNDGIRNFLSVSHPFQLFGSSAGATPEFAFSSNSIGMTKERKRRIKESLRDRVPKTALSRLMLERRDTVAIRKLLESHHSTLPNHWFVVSRGAIWSVELRPVANVKDAAKSQVRFTRIRGKEAYHTNHFHEGNGANEYWTRCSFDIAESKRRLSALKELASVRQQHTAKELRRILHTLREEYVGAMARTAATIVVRLRSGRTTANADYYFDGDAKLVGRRTIPKRAVP